MFWLKNRDPENWRDVQNVDHVLGKYIISDRPMTEEEWARATVQQNNTRATSLRFWQRLGVDQFGPTARKHTST